FFSSRRRHTRCLSDWSSDVCSSDLLERESSQDYTLARQQVCDAAERGWCGGQDLAEARGCVAVRKPGLCRISIGRGWIAPERARSEERRVGHESSGRGWRAQS